MGSPGSYKKRRVWDTECLRSKYIQIWHYPQNKFKNDFKSVQVGFTHPTLSQMYLYQSPCFGCGSGQGYSRHHAVLAPDAKSPWSPPVVPFPVLFLPAAPLSCTFTFPPQNHSVAPAYRWNHEKLAQQPLLSTKREPKHLGDAFGNKTIYFITSSEARCFTKTSIDLLILFVFYFPCGFSRFFAAHLFGSFKQSFHLHKILAFRDMALGKSNIRFMPLNMPIRHDVETCYSYSEVNIRVGHHGILSIFFHAGQHFHHIFLRIMGWTHHSKPI